MQFSKSYSQPFNWRAILKHLELSGVASYAFFNSNDDESSGYFFLSIDGNEVDMQRVGSGFDAGLYGYLGYDLKNQFEQLNSKNADRFGWPDSRWIRSDLMIRFEGNTVCVWGDKDLFHNQVESVAFESYSAEGTSFRDMELKVDTADYIRTIEKIKAEIQQGNVYEVNYCLNFAGSGEIDPLQTFFNLQHITQAPFSCFFKYKNQYVLSGSPERFIKKCGSVLTSEPIKGTAKRDKDPDKDLALKNNLGNNPKEISENIMIVDLVRNDLSKIAKKSSVEVEELCKTYSFRTVHQLVSKIKCHLKDDLSFIEILNAMFPMGEYDRSTENQCHEDYRRNGRF